MATIEESAIQIDSRMQECFELARTNQIANLQLDSGGIGYTLKATAAAFWSLNNHETFEAGLSAVIHEGGDADTNGAVAGALLGARTGYSGIPEHLKMQLVEHELLMNKVTELISLLGREKMLNYE